MNKCRECGRNIPDRFNGKTALRCSACRKEKDEELSEIREERAELEAENQQRNMMFRRFREDFETTKKQYELLRQEHTITINDNERLNKKNEKLTQGVERLFEQIEQLKKELEAVKGIVALNDSVVEKCFDLAMYEETREEAIQYLEENYVLGDDDLYSRIADEEDE